MHADFKVLYSENDLVVTTSVHFSVNNVELVDNKFVMDLKKK